MTKLRWLLVLALTGIVGFATGMRLTAVHAQGAPTVKVTAPANGASVNNPVTVMVQTSGATIKAATDNDPNAAHLHYFVDRDPATVLQPGQPIPSGQPDIIHTADTTEQLPSLSPGQHTVWVVLAHTDHTPFSPNVQDQVRFTIGGGAQAASGAPQGAAQVPTTGRGGLLPSARSGGMTLPALIATVQEQPALLAILVMGTACLLALAAFVLARASRPSAR